MVSPALAVAIVSLPADGVGSREDLPLPIRVVAIVTGHVLGVVLANERAVTLFERRLAVIGQVPLLALMVGYTCGGLLLLFSG